MVINNFFLNQKTSGEKRAIAEQSGSSFVSDNITNKKTGALRSQYPPRSVLVHQSRFF